MATGRDAARHHAAEAVPGSGTGTAKTPMTSWNGGSGPPACITASRPRRSTAGCSSTAAAIQDCKVVIATQNRNGTTIAVPVVEALIQTIRDNQIDVVMIDPFISSHQVPENDNNAIDAVAKTWTMIADVTNTAIDLAHHTRKTGGAEVTVEDGRGAVALLNAVRPARVLNVMTEDEAAKAGVTDGRRSAISGSPTARTIWRCRSTSWTGSARSRSILGNGDPNDPPDQGDDMGVVTKWEWPNAMEGVSDEDFEKVKAAIRAGEWRHNNQAKDWVGHAVAKALGLGDVRHKGLDRTRVTTLVNTWIYKGVLVVVELQDPITRKPKEYVEVAEGALGPLQGGRDRQGQRCARPAAAAEGRAEGGQEGPV